MNLPVNRPLAGGVNPATLDGHGGLTIGIDNDVVAELIQTDSQVRYEKFSAAITSGRHRDERRCDKSNAHGTSEIVVYSNLPHDRE
jgi:ribosomal protein L5